MTIRKIMRQSLPFANVVASGWATAEITPGRTIERIVLKLGGTFTKAMIAMIRIKANGKVFFEGSGTQIDKLMKYRGIADNASYLTIDFTELRGRDKLDWLIGAFDTSKGIGNITMEVQISGATSPTLEAYVIESGAQNEAYAPMLAKVLRYPFSVSVGGKLPIQLPYGQNGAVIKRLHFDTLGGLMTGITVKQDGLVIHESIKALNEFLQAEMLRVPQASWYTVDFALDGNQSNAWDARDARSIEVVPEFSAAESGYVLVEYYDTLGNL